METIFWNVDTQYDFMRNDENFRGALPVQGARNIEKNLEKITNIAEKYDLRVVNTSDWHARNSKEFSDKPDYINKFPPHCLAGTKGADYVSATKPKCYYEVSHSKKNEIKANELYTSRNIVIRKDAFDVFDLENGNPHTQEILNIIKPDRVIVYGVATNYCVDFAVSGLTKRGYEVLVVEDAVKEIPLEGQPQTTYEKWKNQGVNFVKTNNIEDLLNEKSTSDKEMKKAV